MKINDWLTDARRQLTQASIATARLDSLVLLEDCLQKDRAFLLAHPEATLNNAQLAQLGDQLKRRIQHEPLAYIRGKTEFYGRDFYVDGNVLEPRPESETIIELVKQLSPQPKHIADIGTGSGALALTAKLELPNATVTAIDIDPACLVVTKKNAKQYAAGIIVVTGDLIEPFLAGHIGVQPDVLLCNLPYVPDEFQINQAATHEPRLAIFGGTDGLDLYRRLFTQIDQLPNKPVILAESLPSQHAKLAAVAAKHGYQQQAEADFVQIFVTAS